MTAAASRSELRFLLGEDLWSLACSVGQEPVAAELVTPLPTRRGEEPLDGGREEGRDRQRSGPEALSGGLAPGTRAAFHLHYPGGLQLKARRHRDLDTAHRVFRLRSVLDPAHLPRMVAASDLCHLTEWVEGETPGPGDEKILDAAGALQGAMHGAELDLSLRKSGFPYRQWAGRNRRNILELRGAGALSGAEAEGLLRVLAEEAPSEAEGVVIHADLAPENLVLAAGGRLMLVDNENLSVDALGFDLARTWYRWPMDETRWGAFMRGYCRHADPAPFLDHAHFWTLVVLTEAAHFRVLRSTPGASVPLDLLRAEMSISGRGPIIP